MGVIPQGYKKTKVGVIPKDWERVELNEIFNISSKKFNPIISTENKKCIELEHISQNTGILLGYTNSNEQLSTKNIFTKGQVLYGKLRPYLRKFLRSEFDGVCSSEIWVLNSKKVIDKYLFQFVQTDKFNQITNVSSGSKMPRADWKYIAEIPFNIPPLKEQEKIADILTTWDNAISNQDELIKAKEELKKGLMQKLLSGEVRFDGFSDEWEEVRFNKFLTEISKKSTIENEYQILSSTIQDMEIRDGRVDAKTNIGYKILEKNQLVLSPQNLWLGNINFNVKFKIGLVSPSYKIFNINTDILSVEYAKYIFKTNKMLFEYKTCSEVGASVVRRNLDLDSFYLIPIKFPVIEEQQKIAEVLTNADKEIDLLENELEELKNQKKGLMQKLLTGEVRVKV